MNKYETGDIIRHLYKEMTTVESKAFEKALEEDPELRTEYEELKETMSDLDAFHSSPSPDVLNRLKEYASNTSKSTQH